MKKLLIIAATLFSMSAMAITFDGNVPTDIKNQMIGDMAFMTTIQGTNVSPLHNQIYGTMNGTDYKTFLETRVKAIGLNGCGSPNAVACVIPMMSSSKMWITNNYIKFSHPQIARLMVVYHEARHTETRNGNWSHATCPTPFKDASGNDMKSIWTGAMLAGEPACDITPLGSYGSSTIMLKNISLNCENCGEKVKMDAGIYADNQFGRITSEDAKQKMKADIFH